MGTPILPLVFKTERKCHMTFLLIGLIVAILGGFVAIFCDNMMLSELYKLVFDCGDYLTTASGVNFFSAITPTVYGIGISLIVLKFLKKGFDIYVMWTDGDPDSDPMLLLTNFVRAIATALIFNWVYGLFVDICRDVTDTILNTIDENSNFTQEWVTAITSLGIVPAIAGLIFVICFIIIYFSLMARGIEMMVMRMGIPLACAGLLDNDKGIFRAYINQFVKAFITTLVQITLCKIGLALMLQYTDIAWYNIFWGIACMIAAISMPKILREFLIPTGGDGKVGNTVFQTVHVASLAKNVFTK